MIFFPSTRLILTFFFAGLMFSFSVTGLNQLASAAFIGISALLMVVLWDGFSGVAFMRTVTASVVEHAGLSEYSCGELGITVNGLRNGTHYQGHILVVPDIVLRTPVFQFRADSPRSDIQQEFCSLGRGSHKILSVSMATLSPMGFWHFRRRFSSDKRIEVYPALKETRKKLTRLYRRLRPGQNISQASGAGREFAALRNYSYGDSWNDIDWKASARRDSLVVREYQQENAQQILFMLDASVLSSAVFDNGTVLDESIRAMLVFQQVVFRQNDYFGLAIFGRSLDAFVAPSTQKKLGHLCRKLALDLQPGTQVPDYGAIIQQLLARLKRRTLICIRTNPLDSLSTDILATLMPLLTSRHKVVFAVNSGLQAMPLFSRQSGGLKDSADMLAAHRRWMDLKQFQRKMLHCGAEVVIADQSELLQKMVDRYLNIKADAR